MFCMSVFSSIFVSPVEPPSKKPLKKGTCCFYWGYCFTGSFLVKVIREKDNVKKFPEF